MSKGSIIGRNRGLFPKCYSQCQFSCHEDFSICASQDVGTIGSQGFGFEGLGFKVWVLGFAQGRVERLVGAASP